MESIKKLASAAVLLCSGILLGLGFLEVLLRLNSGLLLRGMAASSPVDQPIEKLVYDIHTSDADIFYWQKSSIRPIQPNEDRLEAQVTYFTDEFGFPNKPPLEKQVDVVILGRSYAMGAQAAYPWPRALADKGALHVFNLSQTGSGIWLKRDYLAQFGLPRHPQWVIIEYLPAMDILDNHPRDPLVIAGLPLPVAQSLLRANGWAQPQRSPVNPIYPLSLQIPWGVTKVVFFNHYLESLGVERETLEASRQWVNYKQGLLDLVNLARMNGSCPVILFVPTKESIYVKLAKQPAQLLPAIRDLAAWRLNTSGALVRDSKIPLRLEEVIANTEAAYELISDFAVDNDLLLVDPTDRLTQSILDGKQPFMSYDTHWSDLGHQLVAELILETLSQATCP
jgi:hypothetical protein